MTFIHCAAISGWPGTPGYTFKSWVIVRPDAHGQPIVEYAFQCPGHHACPDDIVDRHERMHAQ